MFLASSSRVNSNEGVEDEDDDGGNDPARFTFVDGVNENVSFFANRGQFPWRPGQPNDVDGNQNCVT